MEKAERGLKSVFGLPVSPEAKALLVGWGLGLEGVEVKRENPLTLWGWRKGKGVYEIAEEGGPHLFAVGGPGERAEEVSGDFSWYLPSLRSEGFTPGDLAQIARWMTHFDAWMGALEPPPPRDSWDLFVEVLSVLSDWEPVRLKEAGGLSPEQEKRLRRGEALLFRIANPIRVAFGPPVFALTIDPFGELVFGWGDTPREAMEDMEERERK